MLWASSIREGTPSLSEALEWLQLLPAYFVGNRNHTIRLYVEISDLGNCGYDAATDSLMSTPRNGTQQFKIKVLEYNKPVMSPEDIDAVTSTTSTTVAGTVAGKFEDYYDTSVEDAEREEKLAAERAKAGYLENGNGVEAEEVDDVDEDKE